MNKYITDDDFIKIVKESKSILEVIKKCGWDVGSWIYRYFYKRTKKLNIDFSHFKGNGTNCGNNHVGGYKKRNIDEILVKGDGRERSYNLRKAYLEYCKLNNIEYKCVICGIKDWLGKKLVLPIDHKDGDGSNNLPENLRWLCPNCHSQTETWGIIKGWNKKKKRLCKGCNEPIGINTTGLCKECYRKTKKNSDGKILSDDKFIIKSICTCCGCEFPHTKNGKSGKCFKCKRKVINRPSLEQINLDFKELGSMVKVGNKYGVTDNAVRKWIKNYNKNLLNSPIV
jgi:hypothetical protein